MRINRFGLLLLTLVLLILTPLELFWIIFVLLLLFQCFGVNDD